jgi:hypothetical protein
LKGELVRLTGLDRLREQVGRLAFAFPPRLYTKTKNGMHDGGIRVGSFLSLVLKQASGMVGDDV